MPDSERIGVFLSQELVVLLNRLQLRLAAVVERILLVVVALVGVPGTVAHGPSAEALSLGHVPPSFELLFIFRFYAFHIALEHRVEWHRLGTLAQGAEPADRRLAE